MTFTSLSWEAEGERSACLLGWWTLSLEMVREVKVETSEGRQTCGPEAREGALDEAPVDMGGEACAPRGSLDQGPWGGSPPLRVLIES